MFANLAYFVVLLAACSCAPDTNVTSIFYRLYGKEVTNFKDFPLKNGVDMLNEKIYDKKHITKIYIDSYLIKPNSYDGQKLIDAAVKTWSGNLLIFDWSNINNASNSNYKSVAAQVEEVGTALGKQLCEMIAAGLEPEKIQIIGFNLGAHVAGRAGYTVQKTCEHKIARIIGLDPAIYDFMSCYGTCRYRSMDENDAAQTTVIRTTTGFVNLKNLQNNAMLHIYVNKNSIQPGCDLPTLTAQTTCFVIRSFDLYVESILHPDLLVAIKSDFFDYCPYTEGYKEDNITVSIGDEMTTAKGSYELTTNNKLPYGKGEKGLCKLRQ